MADRGAKYADKALSKIDKALQSTYRTASRELNKKLADFNKAFSVKDREKRKKRDNGEITEEEYRDWLGGQVFMRKQWESKVKQVNEVMLHHNEQAVRIINESSFDVFAENYYAEAFKSQWICQNISFNVYNSQAIARLIRDNPQLLPEWKIDEKKDYTWNYKKVNNIVQQGIIQGESVEQITQRLCRDLSSMNDNKMRMFARTAITCGQNAGRHLQMEEAAKLDIEQEKRWTATLDGHTRDSHRAMDGETVPWNKPYSNKLMFPGDPNGAPEEVYNCRCTEETIYPQYEDRQKDWREDETIDGVPYEVWKQGKKAAKDWKKGQEKPEEKPVSSNYSGKFYSKNATSNRQIVEQLEKDGFVEAGKGSTLEGIDLNCAKMVYDCYKRTFERFPFLESWDFAGIETASLDSQIYADCKSDTGHIRLGLANFSDISILRANYADDVKNGYHPKGTTADAVIFHEIGHRFDAILQTEAGFGDRYSQMMLEQCLNKTKIRPWRSFASDEVFSQVSIYAGKNNEEWFAECFASYMTAKEEDMSEMQKAWNSLFEEAVRRYF